MTPQALALHPLGVGELLDAATYVYRKNLGTLVGIAAVMAIPIILIQSAVALISTPLDPFSIGQVDTTSSVDISPVIANLIIGLFAGIGTVFEAGAFAVAVSEQRVGRTITIADGYRLALRRWTALLGAAVLIQMFNFVCFVLFVGPFLLMMFSAVLFPLSAGAALAAAILSCVSLLVFIPMVVVFVYFNLRWSVTMPGIMLENLGALKGMGRSWRLVKGSFWRVFAVLAIIITLVNVLTFIVALGVQFGALALFRNSSVLVTIATSAASSVISAVLQPLLFVVITLLYYDLRVRHDGYDLQLALDQLKRPEPAISIEAPA